MTNEEKTLLVGLTVGAVGVPVVLGLVLPWPVWVWVVLVVVLLSVPFQVRRTILYRAQQRELRQQVLVQQQSRAELEQAAATPPPQFQREIVAGVPLPSAVPDYDFVFAATVYWRTVPRPGGWQHANPGALATDAVIVRAREVTIQELPHRYAMAQFRLNSALGTILGDGSGFVEVWATQVQLTLADDDLTRLRKLADVRKDQDVWDHERHHERAKRAYLGDDVLKNTGSAVVWWLAHAKDDIDVRGTVDLIGTLRQLSAAANNSEVPELALPPVAELTAAPEPPPADVTIAAQARRMMDGLNLDEPARAMFVRRLAKVLAASGRKDAAGDLLDTFEPPPEPDPSDEPALDPPTEDAVPVADSSTVDLAYGTDLPRVTDLPPEPDWVEPPRNGVADAVPEWADGPDRTARPGPSGVDSQ